MIRCGLGVGVLLCLLSTSIYLIVRYALYRELDKAIEETAALLSNQIELENAGITFEWQEGIGTNRALIHDGLFQFWNETTGATTRSPGLQSRDLPRFCGPDGTPLIRDITLPGNRQTARAIGLRVYPFILPGELARMQASGQVADPHALPHILVVASNTQPLRGVLTRLTWILCAGTGLTLTLGFVLINRAVRVSLLPIDHLTRQVHDRAGHQLDRALEVPGELPAELTGLANNFGALLARVAATRQRERDFIRNAAHELRTPIAGLQATTELALSQPRDAAAYADHLTTCRNTAAQLAELVQRLSALSRIGQAPAPATLEPIALESILDECLRAFLPVFQSRDMHLTRIPSNTPLRATGDPALLRIILNNLLDNAASHSPPGAAITLRCHQSNGRVELVMANPAADLPDDPDRLFEPLFRHNSSRHDSASHLGIGLTLSREAASAMGATLIARRPDPATIEFVLSLQTCAIGI